MTDYNNSQRCSFCGKSKSQERKLIAGPGVFICNDCISKCNYLLMHDRNTDLQPNTATNPKLPKPAEIKDQLDQYVIGQDRAKK